MRSPLFRMVRYIASRTPACNATAIPVKAMNTVSLSIRVAPPSHIERPAITKFLVRPSPPCARDTPGARLHTRRGTDLSADSRRHGRGRPTALPARALHATGCEHIHGLLRRARATLRASRCPNAAHTIRQPTLPTQVQRETKRNYCHHDLTWL